VGFNAGDGVNFAAVPASRTADIINIDSTSNVGIPGVWMFQVNEETIVSAPNRKMIVKSIVFFVCLDKSPGCIDTALTFKFFKSTIPVGN